MSVQFGVFLTPSAGDAASVVTLAQTAEQAGFDLVTVQDHPYQPKFLDAWTLLSYLGAATERVQLSANVHNLPLRPPAVLARSAASLDLLTGGRVMLGLGAGVFWDAIVAMGGPSRTPGQSVEALSEAITVVRELWDTSDRGGVFLEGEHYPIQGAKRGPAPAHDIPICVGAYKPRMLRLVGRQADGWWPSLPMLESESILATSGAIIDEAARAAGRDPAAIRRIVNITMDDARVDRLVHLAQTYGVSTFVVMGDDADVMRRLGDEVLPAVRTKLDAG